MCAFLPLRSYCLGIPTFLLVLHSALAICLIFASSGGKLYECFACIYLICMIFHMSSSYLVFYCLCTFIGSGQKCACTSFTFWVLWIPGLYPWRDWARWSSLLPTELEGVVFSASHCLLCSSLFSLHLCPHVTLFHLTFVWLLFNSVVVQMIC